MVDGVLQGGDKREERVEVVESEEVLSSLDEPCDKKLLFLHVVHTGHFGFDQGVLGVVPVQYLSKSRGVVVLNHTRNKIHRSEIIVEFGGKLRMGVRGKKNPHLEI